MGIRGISGPSSIAVPTVILDHLNDFDNPHNSAEAAVRIEAGEDIPAFSIVYVGTDGKAYIAKSNIEASINRVVGITRNGGLTGSIIKSEYGGSMDSLTPFSFNPGDQIFFDANGLLTAVKPTSGYIQSIGHAVGATELFLNLGPVVSPGGGFLSTLQFTFLDIALVNGEDPWRLTQNKTYKYHGSPGYLRKAILSCGSPESGTTLGSIDVRGLNVTAPSLPEVEVVGLFPDDNSSQILDNDEIPFLWNSGTNNDMTNFELVIVIEHTGFLPINPFVED